MATGKFWDIIRRGEESTPMEISEFDMKVFHVATAKTKKFDIRYDPKNLITTDEQLIDRAFQAGLEMLLEVGVYNTDTGRVISVTEEEVRQSILHSPSEVVLGEDNERVLLKHRGIESREYPVIIGGVGQPVSEDMRYKIYMAYAMESIIDAIEVFPISTFQGREIKAGSPFEIHAVLDDIALWRKAARDAGRPGMAVQGRSGITAAADFAASRPDVGYRSTDFSNVYILPQLKTNYDSLNRVVHYMHYGTRIMSGGSGLIGGWAGGVEGALVTAIAETLAALVVHNCHIIQTSGFNSLYMGSSEPKPVWVTSLCTQAMTKHTHSPNSWGVYMTYAGPCTRMCMYEIAVLTLVTSLAGCNPKGLCPNMGVTKDYCTPMESRFMGEVAYASTSINREKANEIILELIPKYEKYIQEKNPPKGKKFQDLYDLETLQPKEEYLELYHSVWEELEALGLKKVI